MFKAPPPEKGEMQDHYLGRVVGSFEEWVNKREPDNRARLVREAIIAATANDPSREVVHYGQWVANHATNETLEKLGRLLK